MRYLIKSEIMPFLLPTSHDKWPDVIKLDQGPAIVPHVTDKPCGPEGWNPVYPDSEQYVRMQGVLKDGNHEYLHIPTEHAHKVKIYEFGAAAPSARALI